MYDVLLAVDADESRAETQVRAITDLPVDEDSVFVRVVHVFTDNPAGNSVHKLGSAKLVEERLTERGLEYQLEERSGDPAKEIPRHAAEHDVDLICLAGRKRSPAGKALFGSVTQSVILSVDRPVLVCGDGTDGENDA
ncbi:universal stress protein [Natrialbaceae archaeon GCM10025810]|uniref:universal stress protein n=1 Tax=Halovalidus salilacus TaxID=3075124 RepID=UPI00361F3974